MNYSHVSQGERYQIQALLGCGISQRDIARRLARSASSINREIRRNRFDAQAHYEASSAHRRSTYRRCQAARSTDRAGGLEHGRAVPAREMES